MISTRKKLVILMLGACLSGFGNADEGRLEVNQTCALNGGCFKGDAEGFPVTITQPGSYLLTSNLDLTGFPNTTAIQVSAPTVTIDLGGFLIFGSTTCTGSGASIICSPSGAGHGVEFFSTSHASSVRNGTVKGMSGNGISANSAGMRISHITSMNNGGGGITSTSDTLITHCVVIENFGSGVDTDAGSIVKMLIATGNGGEGIQIDGPGGIAQTSAARGNGNAGFDLFPGTSAMGVAASENSQGMVLRRGGSVVHAALHSNGEGILGAEGKAVFDEINLSNNGQGLDLLEPIGELGTFISRGNGTTDNCGSGICTSSKRFYLTQQTFFGDAPLGACATGFHMASLWEILNTSALRYDYELGLSGADTGFGPPDGRVGWIRNGFDGETEWPPSGDFQFVFGEANCNAWQSASMNDRGASIYLPEVWQETCCDGIHGATFPWVAPGGNCGQAKNVWCVED